MKNKPVDKPVDKPTLEMAIEFGLDFQEKSGSMKISHADIITIVLKAHINNIDRQACTDKTVAFKDGSKAKWVGNAWSISKD